MKSDSMRTPPWKIFIIMSFFGGLSGKLQDGIANKRYIPRKVLVIESLIWKFWKIHDHSTKDIKEEISIGISL